MSRYLIISRRKVETHIENEKGCKYKVNGKCFNNSDYKLLGKRCICECNKYEEEDMGL